MEFDIQKRRIRFQQRNSQYLRAIELFVLLVALHCGKSRVKVSSKQAYPSPNKNNLVINVSEKIRAARMLAAMKFWIN